MKIPIGNNDPRPNVVIDFFPGERVTYIGNPYKEPEKGIVKSISDDGLIFVVFNCADDWGNYQEYTAAGCNPISLIKGWH